MKKTILGLDLGTNSIGWALVDAENNEPNRIIAMGSRIIPLSSDDRDEFLKGNAISKNQKRTLARTIRKGYNRKQIRKKELRLLLTKLDMFPNEQLIKLHEGNLWQLRSDAANEEKNITRMELGRVLLHLNQKRGYKSARSEANMDKKDTDYVKEVKKRFEILLQERKTIGQYISDKINYARTNNLYFRKKDLVFPREAYLEEFEAIIEVQKKKHPLLTDEIINTLRNEIIFYQRPLKSQKGLVSLCEFESFEVEIKKNDKLVKKLVGPRVAPRSSPLNQLCKIWETINNISLKVKNPQDSKYKWGEYIPTLEQKQLIAEHLFNNVNLSFEQLIKILELHKENVYVNKQILKGLQGNTTIAELKKFLDTKSPLLKFELNRIPRKYQAYLFDKKTGEITQELDAFIIEDSFENQPLYKLWHTIYSIKDTDECKRALIKNFNLTEGLAENLSKIDFNKSGYSNKSHKSIRKILPYLMLGYNYSDSCGLAGYNHANNLTKEENNKRILKDKLDLIPKNGLRQPIVEKILNQMINMVNGIIDTYGPPNEIRVELARELKQSKDERNEAFSSNISNNKLNAEISKRLQELGLPATKRFIQKYKYIFPVRDKKINESKAICQCIYCGENFNLSEALSGDNFDVDHIIPKSLLFDDSQLNKVLVHRKCNKDKTNTTAYDYLATKGEVELNNYIRRVDEWYKSNVISYGKMLRLKVSYKEYTERKKQKKETESDKRLWENFIDRSLRETAYISKKAKSLLMEICRDVYTTEGGVTSKLRQLWGWDDVLMNLQIEKYRALGQTEWKEWTSEHGSKKHKKEIISKWEKRDDHRHHAIDALVVACTQQGFIQRINTLNADETKDEIRKAIEVAKKELGENFDEIIFSENNEIVKNRNSRLTELERYLISQRPRLLTTKYVMQEAEKILVSFKAGKKVATTSKFKAKGLNQTKGIIAPRGPLHEQFIYGKIKQVDKEKPLKYLFENSNMIIDSDIREKIEQRIIEHNNNIIAAYNSLKKEPIFMGPNGDRELRSANCYKEEIVIKYPIQAIKKTDIPFILDKRIRTIIQNRIEEFNGKENEAFKSTLWFNEVKQIPILSVRMLTGLNNVEPVKKDESGKDIGFVKPGNNHHVAIYTDSEGKFIQHICTFWHAVERKKYQLPVIIENTNHIWSSLLNSNIPESVLNKLPPDNLTLKFSLQNNEMFIFGMTDEDIKEVLDTGNIGRISENLYLVWSLSDGDFWFRHHLETKNSELKKIEGAKESKRFFRFKSVGAFLNSKPKKVKITNLGQMRFNFI